MKVILDGHLLINLFVSLSRIGCTFGVMLTVMAYLESVRWFMEMVVVACRGTYIILVM